MVDRTATNKPRLGWIPADGSSPGFWLCYSARVMGWGRTPRAAWARWKLNCHTVTKVTQTAIGDGANKDYSHYIATADEEAPK